MTSSQNTRMVLLQWTTLSEVFTITYPSWVVLHSMVQSFIELHKLLCQKKAVIHEVDRFSMQIIILNMGGLHPINQCSSVAHSFLTLCYPMDCSPLPTPRACSKWKWKVKFTQSCLTLCNPMGYSLPCSSIHGIFQQVLEWVAISFSKGSSQSRDWTQVSWIVGRCFRF